MHYSLEAPFFPRSSLKVTLGELAIALRLKQEGGVINLSAERTTLAALRTPGANLRALMHACRTARVSAPSPEQTGHLFTRRSKSAGCSAVVAASSLPPTPSPLPVGVPYFSRSALACATSSCCPLSRSNRRGTRRGAARREIKGRREGRGTSRPPSEGHPGAGRAGAAQSGVAWGLMDGNKSRERNQQSATAAFPASVDLPCHLQVSPLATSPSTAALSLIVVGSMGGERGGYSRAPAQRGDSFILSLNGIGQPHRWRRPVRARTPFLGMTSN